MKKLIAIAVVLALVAGAAFAEVTYGIGGEFGYKLEIARGDYKGSPVTSNLTNDAARFDLTIKDSEGKFGGSIRFFTPASNGGTIANYADATYPRANGWWKPVDLFKFQIGRVDDWGTGSKIGDGLPSYVGKGLGSIRNYNPIGAGFGGGFAAQGVGLSLYPVDFVEVNLGVPFTLVENKTSDVFADVTVNVLLKFAGSGDARLTFKSSATGATGGYASAGSLFAAYHLKAIEKVPMELGLKLLLPFTNALGDLVSPGVGVSFVLDFKASDAFDLKIHTGATLGQTNTPAVVGMQLIPSIVVADGKLKAFLNTGIALKFPFDPDDDNDKVDGEWFVNPCFNVPMGNLTFTAGLQLNGGFAAEMMTWGIPVGMKITF